MKLNFYRKALLLFASIICISHFSRSQSFSLYIEHDTIISPTQYKFDLKIFPSSSFYFRSAQFGFRLNTSFVPAGANISYTFDTASTTLINFNLGPAMWNSTYCALSIPASTGSVCSGSVSSSTSTLIMSFPKMIGTFTLISDIPFLCDQPDLSLILPTDNVPLGVLKTAITKWGSNCSATDISNNGSYSNWWANTLYANVHNPVDTLCTIGVPELEDHFSIYPNPASENIFISSTIPIGVTISIFDISGRVVKEFKNVELLEKTVFNVSEIPAGLYFVKIGNSRMHPLTISKS